jgi:hypothetical protein
MRFGTTHEKRFAAKAQAMRWHLWFAWRPVQLEDGRWVWWETVFRSWLGPILYEYRALVDPGLTELEARREIIRAWKSP